MGNASQNAEALILVGQLHYKDARLRTLVMAWAFGRHIKVRSLGWRARVAFWRGKPYLLTLREPA